MCMFRVIDVVDPDAPEKPDSSALYRSTYSAFTAQDRRGEVRGPRWREGS